MSVLPDAKETFFDKPLSPCPFFWLKMMLASEKGEDDRDAERPGECPSRLDDPGGVVDPDQRGDVGVDQGDNREEL